MVLGAVAQEGERLGAADSSRASPHGSAGPTRLAGETPGHLRGGEPHPGLPGPKAEAWLCLRLCGRG